MAIKCAKQSFQKHIGIKGTTFATHTPEHSLYQYKVMSPKKSLQTVIHGKCIFNLKKKKKKTWKNSFKNISMPVKNAKRHRESIYELLKYSFICHLPFSIVSLMIRHMVNDLDGIWNMENHRIQASHHYVHTFIYPTEPYHLSFQWPKSQMENIWTTTKTRKKNTWSLESFLDAEKKCVKHWTIFTIGRTSTHQQRHNK